MAPKSAAAGTKKALAGTKAVSIHSADDLEKGTVLLAVAQATDGGVTAPSVGCSDVSGGICV